MENTKDIRNEDMIPALKNVLLTDLYQLTMMQGYFLNSGANVTVVFDAFYRTNPMNGGYAIFAGLEQLMDYVDGLHFDDSDISYLRSLGIFRENFLEYLSKFHFSGSIYAMTEGTVMFPREPMIKVIAPIIEAQLIETAILNILNHQSLIATKASRVCHAAQGDDVMEFGLRRAQGPDAGLYGARAAVIGGCCATSNVLCGKLFGVPVRGTNAHSWVMSFPDEYSAFKSYASLYPQACLLIADTYDTLRSGVPNAIRVFREMKEEGLLTGSYGIRLDSGDLAYLSKHARKMLDDAGFPEASITASNDLDENLIVSLKIQGACVDAWGVGTSLITSSGWSAFGGVYKLAAIMGSDGKFIPKIKLSENSEKITNPGNKKIYRMYDKENGKIKADLICMQDEVFSSDEDMVLFDPLEPWKKTYLKAGEFTIRELMIPVFEDGKPVYSSPSVMEIRDYCRQELSTLWEETRRLVNPQSVFVDLSDTLYDVKKSLLHQMG